MEEEKQIVEKKSVKRGVMDNIFMLYIVALVIVFAGQIIGNLVISLGIGIASVVNQDIQTNDAVVTWATYVVFFGIWGVVLLWLLISKKNSPMLQAITGKCKGNTILMLLLGLLIGFLLNGLCILVAWMKGDIFLHFEAIRPVSLILIFIAVFIQSSAEELVCRGVLYQRILKGYKKPVIAIVGNALFFALLHLGNEGVTFLSVVNILVVGIMMSLFVYYMDSLWCAMAVHTAWNFTQNIIFGLPNSGMVMPYSIFKLDESTARNSFAYNVSFGIEGTLLADLVVLVACVLIYLWGKKYAKKPLDIWNYESQVEGAKEDEK